MSAPAWLRRDERGSAWLIRAFVASIIRLPAWMTRPLLYPISAFYYLTSPETRLVSQTYLSLVLQRRAGARDVFRHLLTFSETLLDRVVLLSPRWREIRVDVVGLEHLVALHESGRGCILMGAHLGCFEAIRAVGMAAPVVVRPVMIRRPSGVLSRVLDEINPGLSERIIEMGSPDAALQIRESLARGEFVGILADRAPSTQKTLTTHFFGRPARLPTGPFRLASALGAPVSLCFGLRVGPRRYEVSFEPFAERVTLGRTTRDSDLQAWLDRFCGRLETMCRQHPFNWFNFYPFWEGAQDAEK